MAGRNRLVTLGFATVALALLGWIATLLAGPFLQHPAATEDLTAAWTQAGPTPLGTTTAVEVPPGRTLVAFLVGTGLYGPGGTTGGSCEADTGGRPIDLGWPVYVNPSLTGMLADGQQTVAVAGWTNGTAGLVRVDVRCTTGDSTVDHYVAVPTRTAVVSHRPWFQPWAWVVTAVVGIALIAAGAQWINPPSR